MAGAIIAIWNDIAPGAEENFREWHNREHVPERVSIPGFLSGHRYRVVVGRPQYFTLYFLADDKVGSSPHYLERLNNPTPWTARIVPTYENMSRAIGRVVYCEGIGRGAAIGVIRLQDPSRREGAVENTSIIDALAATYRMPGITGVHFCVSDDYASSIQAAEKKGHPIDFPWGVILLEGSTSSAVAGAGNALLQNAEIETLQAEAGELSVFVAEISVCRQDLIASLPGAGAA